AVGRGTDDDDPGQQADQRDQPLPDDLLVIGDQHPDIRAHRASARGTTGACGAMVACGVTGASRVTRPGVAAGPVGSPSRTWKPWSVGPAVSLPPSSSARSRIPVSPYPPKVSPPADGGAASGARASSIASSMPPGR